MLEVPVQNIKTTVKAEGTFVAPTVITVDLFWSRQSCGSKRAGNEILRVCLQDRVNAEDRREVYPAFTVFLSAGRLSGFPWLIPQTPSRAVNSEVASKGSNHLHIFIDFLSFFTFPTSYILWGSREAGVTKCIALTMHMREKLCCNQRLKHKRMHFFS